MLKENLFLWIF